MGPHTETTESAAAPVLVLSAESALVPTAIRGLDPPPDGVTAIQRVQPGEPVAGNLLGGFCEGGRAQEVHLKTCPYPPQPRQRLDDQVHGASRRRSSHTAADSEMVEGRSNGGRSMVGTGDRYTTGLGDFTVARQRVSALRVRSLGERLASEVGARRSGRHPICR